MWIPPHRFDVEAGSLCGSDRLGMPGADDVLRVRLDDRHSACSVLENGFVCCQP
ncbi:hypothetical protein PANA5342_2623 [Pantoea ananatis LMG 5342]|nr:hypothetical protein PANA5342_2623 [Pantoea ananatis LMG 5342]